MQIVDINPVDPIPRHGRDGRPKIFAEDQYEVPEKKRKGEFYTRMTTFIDCLEDKSNLSAWKQRNVAVGLSRRPGLLTAFGEIADPMGEGKRQADALIHEAEQAADADLKAKIGDALHEIIERINKGLSLPFIPPEHEDDIKAYIVALRREGIVVVLSENFVVLDKYKAAGTFDILGLHYPKNADGSVDWDGVPKLRIMDVKTGRIDYGRSKIGMQLTGYGQSQFYNPYTFKRTPIQWTLEDGTVLDVDQEKALIIHLPAGKGECSIVPVDMKDATDGLELAWNVRQFRKRKFDEAALTAVQIG